MALIRSGILAVAHGRVFRRAITSGVGRRVALRFVAGESLDDAVGVIRSLNARGAAVSLDYLGENVTEPATAQRAAAIYLEALERLHTDGLRANLAVKLTQMGLDLDPEVAVGNAALVVHRALEAGTTLTLDMEDHRYTDRTIGIGRRLAERYPGRVGVALQAYLRRTPDDLERLVAGRIPVRLCKGAYLEPRSIAHRRKADVDRAFARFVTRLLEAGPEPMIATHDERLIRFAIREAARLGRSPQDFEFQMLYGVGREIQRRLVEDGYRLRVYVPFGREWYPYLMRRIAERPANLRFFLEALIRG